MRQLKALLNIGIPITLIVLLVGCSQQLGKGSGGDPGTFTDSPTCQYQPIDYSVHALGTLTNQEYSYVFNDLGGDRSEMLDLTKDWAPNTPTFHFNHLTGAHIYNLFVKDRLKAAELLADAVYSNSDLSRCFLDQYLPFARKCMEDYLTANLAKLWRSDSISSSLNKLNQLYGSQFGLSEEYSMNSNHRAASIATLTAVFLSPKFIFKLRYPKTNRENEILSLSSWEIAEKLAFQITSSLPDQTLLDLARSDQLNDPKVIMEQAERLLNNSEYLSRMALKFSGQWLDFLNPTKRDLDIEGTNLNFNEFATETYLVFRDLLANNSDSRDLLQPGFTYVNRNLARHYNLSSPTNNFAKVMTEDRGGLLQQGATLFDLGDPDQTRPVARGIWVLDRILCKNIPLLNAATQEEIQESSQRLRGLPVHERLARHRQNPRCNSCHSSIDPIGLGLENYSSLAIWREQYENRNPVFANGKFEGKTFSNSDGLVEALKSSDLFNSCVQRKVHSFATKSDPYHNNSCGQKELKSTNNLKSLFINSYGSPIFRNIRFESKKGN